MSLPIQLNTPKYMLDLPISKKTIEYRPYLVKEEKILMMAMESSDQKMIMKAVQDIIRACTFEKVDVRKLPSSELEYIFLKLRSKSVGESAKIKYPCKSCETMNDIAINLEEVEIDTSKLKDNKIMLTDTVGVIMKLPDTNSISKVVGQGSEIQAMFDVISGCIDALFDDNGTYEAKDIEKKDLDSFVESLNSQQFKKISEYLEGVPRLSKAYDFKCESCGTDNHIEITGLQNFFG